MDGFPSLTSSRSSGAGHDSSLYVDGHNDPEPADEDDRQRFQCCVHGGLLREPFQTKCGHRICRGCLGVFLEGAESRPCPVAEEDCLPVTRQNVSPDMSCVREMRKMMVYCVNKASGCQLTCKYQDLKNHVLECEYAVVTCPHASRGCQNKVLRKDLKSHVQSCVWRPTNCPLCRAEVSYCHMQYHDKEECEEKVTGCPYSCGNTTLRRKEVQGHRNACPVRPVSCKFEPMGCTFVNKKELVDQHIKDAINYHLELASSRLQEISQKRTGSEHEYQELSSRYTELEHSVQSVRTQEQAAIRQVEQQGRDFRLKIVDLIERVIMLERKMEGQMASGRQVQQLEHTVSDIDRRLSQVEERQQRGDGGRDGGGQGVAGRYASVNNMAEVVSTQLADHDRQLSMHDVRMAEMDLRFQLLETASYDGTLFWKIRDYARRKRDAVSGRTLSLYSQPFYTSRFGYKMCARVYLNGDGMGKKTHMSIFFVVMRGEYDPLLTWPFNLKVSLTLMDQSQRRRHLTDHFVPDPTSSSFQRPTGEMNVASGCPLFVSQSLVENPENGYVMDDTIFIRISVGQSAST